MLKASSVQVLLTAADIEAALEQYTAGKVEEFRVQLEDGALRARMKVPVDKLRMAVPVELRLQVRHAEGTLLELDVEWVNLPLLPSTVKEAALKRAFEALPGRYHDGSYDIDLTEMLEQIPVSFRVAGLGLRADGVRIALIDMVAFPVEVAGLVEAPAALPVPVPSVEEARLPEHQGFYRQLREKMTRMAAHKAPRWAQPLMPWLLAVPDFFVLLVRLARDERVPAGAKLIAAAAVTYFLSPVNLIPDAIPLIGQIDDLAVALYAVEQIAERVPPEVVQELWPGDGQVLDLVKSGTQTISRALPAKMLVAIKRLVQPARR